MMYIYKKGAEDPTQTALGLAKGRRLTITTLFLPRHHRERIPDSAQTARWFLEAVPDACSSVSNFCTCATDDRPGPIRGTRENLRTSDVGISSVHFPKHTWPTHIYPWEGQKIIPPTQAIIPNLFRQATLQVKMTALLLHRAKHPLVRTQAELGFVHPSFPQRQPWRRSPGSGRRG